MSAVDPPLQCGEKRECSKFSVRGLGKAKGLATWRKPQYQQQVDAEPTEAGESPIRGTGTIPFGASPRRGISPVRGNTGFFVWWLRCILPPTGLCRGTWVQHDMISGTLYRVRSSCIR